MTNRRTFTVSGLTLLGSALWPLPAAAATNQAEDAIRDHFGDRAITVGRVSVELPPLSENGYSVPLKIAVDSPMTAADHVQSVSVFAEENPLANVAHFQLGPHAGRALVETRIRMGGSQHIHVVAEMSDGSLWRGKAFGVVTLAACVL